MYSFTNAKWMDSNCILSQMLNWMDSNCILSQMLNWMDSNCILSQMLNWVDSNCILSQMLNWMDSNSILSQMLICGRLVDFGHGEEQHAVDFYGLLFSVSYRNALSLLNKVCNSIYTRKIPFYKQDTN